FVPYALDRGDMAGAIVVVTLGGRTLFQKGYGYANIGRKVPMDPARTVVPVASISKTFTWTAVLQLVEQGKLDLDRDVNEYLDFVVPAAFGTPITLRHLMTHTAGFEETIRSKVAAGDPPESLGAHLKHHAAPDRIYPPGTVQAYSNYGAELAGYIVERASGELFPDYIQRHILDPLGMTASSFRWPVPEALRKDVAAGYSTASSGEPLPPEANIEEAIGGPAGSLLSTGADIARYMEAHLDQGRFPGGSLFSAETADRMDAPAFTPMPGAQPTALGFFRGDYNGHRILLHDGDASGTHADMELLMDDRVGFFSVVNSDGTGGLIGASYGFRSALFHAFMDRYFPKPPEPEQPTAKTAAEHARVVAGEYEMSRRPDGDFMKALYLAARIKVRALDDGTIETPAFINFERGRPQRWREVGPFDWREVGGGGRLVMKVENGRVVGWLPRDLSGFLIEPVPYLRSAALNLPLLAVSAGVLAIAGIGWPISAWRRRRAVRTPVDGQERTRRATRIAAVTGLAFLLGWALVLLAVSSGGASFDPKLDPWIRLVHLIGVMAVAGAAISWWSVWVTWRRPGSIGSKAFSLIVALALADLVWFSFAFNLISARLNY
ncbi:MAG: serine hydrolase domain-containing protein, partial [Gemmatimonadota bacterium]